MITLDHRLGIRIPLYFPLLTTLIYLNLNRIPRLNLGSDQNLDLDLNLICLIG